MRMYDIILKKRANVPLTDEEIRFVIDGYVKGDIPDYQVSALLMTIVFNGMSARELGTLTLAMAQSGHMVDLFLMIRRPPRSTQPVTLFPYTMQ